MQKLSEVARRRLQRINRDSRSSGVCNGAPECLAATDFATRQGVTRQTGAASKT